MSTTRKVPATLSKQDALGMLASAINYCQQAGFTVRSGNTEAGLVLALPEAHIERVGPLVQFCEGKPPACANCDKPAESGRLCVACASNPDLAAPSLVAANAGNLSAPGVTESKPAPG